jgi:hypothetical protein
MRMYLVYSAVLASVFAVGGAARAQNDWQFPDPYFGIIEIEKSHAPTASQRYRVEGAPAARAPAGVPRSRPRFLRSRVRSSQGRAAGR